MAIASGLRQALRSNLARIARPSYADDEAWRAIRTNLHRGNLKLASIMGEGGAPSEWEWGGYATPHGVTSARTGRAWDSVDPGPLPPQPPLAVAYHSHPTPMRRADDGRRAALSEPSRAPNALSVGDLAFALQNELMGITSLESAGGLGYAIRAKGAPRIPYYVLHDAEQEAMEAARPLGRGLVYKYAPDPFILNRESFLAASLGLGQALKRRGAFEQYGYAPSEPGQRRLYYFDWAPAIRAAEPAALAALNDYLGKGALAALLSAGLLPAMMKSRRGGGNAQRA